MIFSLAMYTDASPIHLTPTDVALILNRLASYEIEPGVDANDILNANARIGHYNSRVNEAFHEITATRNQGDLFYIVFPSGMSQYENAAWVRYVSERVYQGELGYSDFHESFVILRTRLGFGSFGFINKSSTAPTVHRYATDSNADKEPLWKQAGFDDEASYQAWKDSYDK